AWAGWAKWLLLFCVLACEAPLVVNRSEKSLGARSAALRWTGLIFAVWMVSSAVGGILAVSFAHRLRLGLAASAFAALPLYFWPAYALWQDGVLQGLEKLAGWPPLKFVSRWPREPKAAL